MIKFRYACLAILLISTGALVHYVVPQTDIVRAVGVETKRVDTDGDAATAQTRDVYFVQTERLKNAKPMVYRNEDNLLYLKWDSADKQARAQSLSAEKEIVAVRHYGWRVQLFSAFPNVLNIKVVEREDDSVIPYLLLAVLALVWGGILLLYRKMRLVFGPGGAEYRKKRRDERAERRAKSQENK